MVEQTQRNKNRAQRRWERQDKTVRSFAGAIKVMLENAERRVWTFEKILEHRGKNILENPAYQKLPYSEKRYLDGVWDTLYNQFDKKLCWTHVLDDKRFDAFDRLNEEMRNGREREIMDNNLSCFAYERVVQGEKIFIPYREANRVKEFERVPGLKDMVDKF